LSFLGFCFIDLFMDKAKRIRDVLPWLEQAITKCELCPRACKVNRKNGELGFCKTGVQAQVASFDLHFGEERILVGQGGSGTIFFAHCNLGCVFCQNYEISNNDLNFPEVSAKQLALIMLELQTKGAENINLVTPSHVALAILQALDLALAQGLNLPVVYNTSSYDSPYLISKLEGIVDIYLADLKFFSSQYAQKYTQAPDYPQLAQTNVLRMYEQVGGIKLNAREVAQKGLIIRHLILPNDLGQTQEWLEFLHANKLYDVYLNLMDQYHPAHKAHLYPELQAGIDYKTLDHYVQMAKKMGFKYIDQPKQRLFRLLSW